MEFKNLVTLWILCLCLVGESWAEKPSSPTADSQVVENGVSGECLVIRLVSRHVMFLSCRLLCVVLPPRLSTCWAQQMHTADRQWVYYSTCHIAVIFFFLSSLRELYVAMLRIVQLAFSIKPCPLSQIRLTAQTNLYNEWNMECTADFYPVSLCRRWQAGMYSPDYRAQLFKMYMWEFMWVFLTIAVLLHQAPAVSNSILVFASLHVHNMSVESQLPALSRHFIFNDLFNELHHISWRTLNSWSGTVIMQTAIPRNNYPFWQMHC